MKLEFIKHKFYQPAFEVHRTKSDCMLVNHIGFPETIKSMLKRDTEKAIFRFLPTPPTVDISFKMAWIVFALALLSLSVAQDPGTVLQPPLIVIPDRPQKLYYAENERVVVKCEAQGTPHPEYEWQRNGKVIESDNKFIKFDPRTGTLEIPSLTEREEGVFVCRASNVVGGNVAVSFSHPQTLLASRVESFKDRGPIPDINTNEFAYARMRCTDQGEVVDDPRDITYKWYITEETQQVDTDNGRLYISGDGTLHFTYTLATDELTSSNTYHCGISSLKSRLIRLGPPMILRVQPSDSVNIQPVLVYSNSGVQAMLGSVADLECVFSGHNMTGARLPVVTWFDAGKPVKADGVKYTLLNRNRVLRITDVQEIDDKTYECGAAFGKTGSRKHSVLLNVTSAPLWKQAPEGTTVTEGRDVQIHCNARSLSKEEPPLLPVWYINGQSFETVGKSNAVLSFDRKVMTISDVTKAHDILCVQCIVANSVGETMGDACINVIIPIRVVLTCDKCNGKSDDECNCNQWEISKGDSVRFTLAVTTDPGYVDKLTEEWAFKDETYKLPQLPPFWKRDLTSQVYHFNTSDLSDEDFLSLGGKYHFKVFHAYDSMELSIMMQVKGVTPAPAVQSASVDMWIIGLVIGLVFLLIVIILIIFVIVCRKQQEGVYNLGKKETGAGLDPAKELKEKAFHDLSRPDYEDYEYPDSKPKGELEYDDVPIEGDDESLGEYGDEEDIHFNEDGSFIGNYSVKPNSHNRTTESTI